MTKRWGIIAIILATIFTVIIEMWGIANSNYSTFTKIFSTIVYFTVFAFIFMDVYYTIVRWKDLYYIYSLIRDVCWIVVAISFFHLIENWITMGNSGIITLAIITILFTHLSIVLTKLSGKYIK